MRIIIALLAFLAASPAMAVEKIPDCTTWEAQLATLPPGFVRAVSEPIIGPKGQALIAQWNAMTPPTAFEGDTVRFAFFSTGQVGVAIIAKGCIVDKSILSPELFNKLLEPIKGASI